MIGHDAQYPVISAKHKSPGEQQQAHDQKQRDRREVTQDVLLVDSAAEARQKEQRKSNARAKWIQIRMLCAVSRRNRDIYNARIVEVERDQNVIFEKIASVQRFKFQPLESCATDRRVPVLRIEYLPVAGSEFIEKSQNNISQQPVTRHRSQRGSGKEAIALRIVIAVDDGIQKPRQIFGSHLAVSVHLHDDIASQLTGFQIPEGGRAAHTLIAGCL